MNSDIVIMKNSGNHNPIGGHDLSDLLFIGKYPPIQGGVSTQNFWRLERISKDYPEWNIHILTNSYDVEEEYRIKVDDEFLNRINQQDNINLYAPDPVSVPRYIPKYWPMSERLISLGLKMIKEIEPDIIDAGYYLPYVFVGWVLSKESGIPIVIRHAGSDIERILKNDNLRYLYKLIVSDVNGIITNNIMNEFFIDYGADKFDIYNPSNQRSVPLEHFSPDGNELNICNDENKIIFFFPGKPSKGKGVYLLIKTLSDLKEEGIDFVCVFTSGPKGKEFIINLSRKWGVENNVIIMDFFPPWKMPEVYRSVDIVVCPEHNFNVDSHGSMIPREAFATGTPVIVSKDIAKSFPYSLLSDLPSFDPYKPGDFKEKILESIIKVKDDEFEVEERLEFSNKIEDISQEAKDTIDIYNEVIQ